MYGMKIYISRASRPLKPEQIRSVVRIVNKIQTYGIHSASDVLIALINTSPLLLPPCEFQDQVGISAAQVSPNRRVASSSVSKPQEGSTRVLRYEATVAEDVDFGIST